MMWRWGGIVRSTDRSVFLSNPNALPLLLRRISRESQIPHVYASSMPSASAAGCDIGIEVPAVRSLVSSLRHYSLCYWQLSKARLSMLVVATTGTGFILGSSASWAALDISGLCWTCAGTMMVAASANSVNQLFEISNDSKMKRTCQRPLPSGRITLPHAATWASAVGLTGTTILAIKADVLAAGLAASNLILYSFIYTPLKQIHPINTWVGAIVGAIPPLLGWVAAGGDISLSSMILPAALYYWQIPHFMALAYFCRKDYAEGGFKMISLFDPTGSRTASVALRNCLYLLPISYLSFHCGLTSKWFAVESSAMTLAIAATAFYFYRDRTTRTAKRMFHASLLYLPVFMSGLLLHRDITVENEDSDLFVRHGDTQLTNETVDGRRRTHASTHGLPPVAYASVAPFPFLPAPSYAAS